jgi:ACS family sodium-dependent inorganic phosphate cotransporter-like MFS transporter 5
LPQIFAGRLSELYGAKYLIGFSILISGLVNLLTPVMVRSSFTVFIGSRVVLGFVQGIVFPAFYALFAKWIPEEEHSTFMPWLYVGITIGTVVASTGSGNMIESNFMGGWPSVFYVSGI